MLRLTGLVILGLGCASAAAAQSPMNPAERESTLTTFEYVWKTVQDKYWDPKIGGLDWKAVHDELRPKVEAAKNREEARAVMSEMLDRLKQSHFGIFPREVFEEVNPADPDAPKGGGGSRDALPGIDLRIVDGHALVTSVEPGSPAAVYGVKPGWEIVKVRGVAVATVLEKIGKQFHDSTMLDLIQTRSVLGRLQGSVGSKVKVDFIDGKDHAVAAELDRAAPRGKVARMGNLPPMYFVAEWRKTPEEIGYARFTQFLEAETVAKTMEDAVKACGQCKGFVIDLRGNPGGIGGLAMGMAGWFVEDSGMQLGTEILRGMTLKFIVSPRPEPFRGPLAVLVDGNSASTSEIFAGGMKDIKRARIFGTRTAGAALPSVIERLPNGDGFQYAIANYISDGGKPLEGIGVIPDQEVGPTRRSLLDGHDAAMDAAVRWIQAQKK